MEDPAHNGDDVSENDVQNVEPEQSDTSEPIVSGNPQDVPRLRNVNDDIATKLDENEKSPSASNNAKEDKNPPTMESSTPPTKLQLGFLLNWKSQRMPNFLWYNILNVNLVLTVM